MNLKTRLKNAYNGFFNPSRELVKNISYQTLSYLLSGGGSEIQILNVNSKDAYNNKIFYAGQNILIRKITEAPIMFSQKKQGKTAKVNKFYSVGISNEKRALLKAQVLTELENHPLNVLFDKPNNYQTGIELMEDFWYNYTFGDGFIYFETLVLSRNNKPIAIHSLSRDRVTPIVSSNENIDLISHYEYIANNGLTIRIEKQNILHLKNWNPNIGDLKGYGINNVISTDVNLSNSNNKAQLSAFINGGRGTLFSSDVVSDPNSGIIDKMTSEQMQALKETIIKDYAGASNYKKMHFTNGAVDVKNFGDTVGDMELIKAEDSNWKSIFTIIGVPFFLAPIEGVATYDNVKYGYKALVTNTVLPLLKKFDQKLTQYVSFWWPDIVAVTDVTEFSELAPDLKLMKETYGSPLLTTDELRAVFNYDAIGGDIGKSILVPSGLMKIEDIISNDFDSIDTNDNPTSL